MQLTRFIQELLYQYECVTIPHFGAFLTRSFNAQVDPGGFFYPPRKEVNFNQLLTANDGLLAHYIARKENVTYENALRTIEKEVSSWKKKLQTQTLRFPGVGEIRLNQEAEEKIKRPSKGKKVTQSEYNTIMADKMEEMSERFRAGDGRRGASGRGVSIRIQN